MNPQIQDNESVLLRRGPGMHRTNFFIRWRRPCSLIGAEAVARYQCEKQQEKEVDPGYRYSKYKDSHGAEYRH